MSLIPPFIIKFCQTLRFMVSFWQTKPWSKQFVSVCEYTLDEVRHCVFTNNIIVCPICKVSTIGHTTCPVSSIHVVSFPLRVWGQDYNPCCSMLAAVFTILYCLKKSSYIASVSGTDYAMTSQGENKSSVCVAFNQSPSNACIWWGLVESNTQKACFNLKGFSPFQELKQLACSFLPPDCNECLSDPCNVNANCANIPGSFTCTCIPGYTGDGLNCIGTAPVKK